MGNAQYSGQVIAIQNDTNFLLKQGDPPRVIHGKMRETPSEIPPSKAANITNSGCDYHTFGSEIWYKYQFVGTPGESVWHVKIFSEGTYSRANAKCVVQVFEDDTLVAQESMSDRDTKFNRKRSRFRLSRLRPKTRDDLGDGFFEIAVKVTEKPEKIKPGDSKRESNPAENIPPESKPKSKNEDHKPAESKPAESKPVESKPAGSESKSAQNLPPESKPESKNEDHKPAESKPAENNPAESKPAESKPVVSKPAESKSAESRPAEIAMARDVNTTHHVVECSTEQLSQGVCKPQPKLEASGVTAKGASWFINLDETDTGFESGGQELDHNRSLLKPIHWKVIISILAVVAALVLLVVGSMEWIGLALGAVVSGIAGEAAKPMWKWFKKGGETTTTHKKTKKKIKKKKMKKKSIDKW